jgi:hypothetical protein
MSSLSINTIMSALTDAHYGQKPKGILGFLTPKDIRNLSQSNKTMHIDIIDNSQVLQRKCNDWTDQIQAEYDARYRCWRKRVSTQSCSRCGCRAHVDPFGDKICFCNTCAGLGCNVNYYGYPVFNGSCSAFYRDLSRINSRSKIEEDCYTQSNIYWRWSNHY